MIEKMQMGNIGLHNVTRDNVTCKVTDHDGFSVITLDFGMSSVSMFTTIDDVAAIRRILGGW
jgi:hypothetical protein